MDHIFEMMDACLNLNAMSLNKTIYRHIINNSMFYRKIISKSPLMRKEC